MTNISRDKIDLNPKIVFLFALVFLGYSILGGGVFESRLYLPSLIMLGIFFGGLLFWRGLLANAKLPRLGIDFLYLLFLLAGSSRLLKGPDPHVVTRVTLWLGYGLVFYLFLDLFDVGVQRDTVIAALVVATGLLNFLGVAEAYHVYINWWRRTNSIGVLPPEPVRIMGLFGFSSASMGLVNLIAPFTIVLFRNTKKLFYRVSLIYWWLFYLLVSVWSSSRAGGGGVIAWISVFLVLSVLEKGGLDFVSRFWQKISLKQRLLVGAIGAGILVMLSGMYLYLSSHSSHVGFLSGRDKFWQVALIIWKEHPLLGVGPGNYAFEYLKHASIPPQFWAVYPHSVPFQILAETGLVGFGLFLLVVFFVARKLWLNWKRVDRDKRLWETAVISGIVAIAAQQLVDDFTMVPAVIIPFNVILAACWRGKNESLRRWKQVKLSWLALPAMYLVGMLAWCGWAYQPLKQARVAAANADWEKASQLSARSPQRAPHSAFYHTEAGLASSRWWGEAGDSQALNAARENFRTSASLEPTVAVTHANLAMLDWYADEQEAALQAMKRAATLAPQEPVFHANLGWFYEQTGQTELAREAYRQALSIAPGWATHPFWRVNPFRREILSADELSSRKSELFDDPFLNQAWRAYLQEDWQEAEDTLLKATWGNQGGAEILFIRGKIAEARGDIETARKYYSQMADLIREKQYVVSYQYSWSYNIVTHRREGFVFNLTPGFLRLDSDWGQYDALAQLQAWYQQDGNPKK